MPRSPDGLYLVIQKNGLDPDLFDHVIDLWVIPTGGNEPPEMIEASPGNDRMPDWR